jgi:tellurite resistance protein TerC
MGLRSLYFAVAGIMVFFRYLKVGLAFVLTFVGLKMLAAYIAVEIPILLSLAIIITILTISIVASLVVKQDNT